MEFRPARFSVHVARVFLVAVTTEGLSRIAGLLDAGRLSTNVGEVLPLAEARLAHEMLAGKPHKPGKIVLVVTA
jgi:NADPH:quinone reductase-like Zn-dependent oxidoreductase